MNKRKVRCYTAYAESGGIYNNELIYLAQDGYRLILATCVDCGEIFVIDFENPKTAGLGLAQVSAGMFCPSCNAVLSASLRNYPETFVGRDRRVGSFLPPTRIPPPEESKVVELYEIFPL